MLVVPDTNTTMEPEVRALWPEVSELYRVGIPRPMRPILVSDLPEYGASAVKAAREVASKHPVDLVIYGCTTAGFLTGPEGDAKMQRDLSDAVGAPAVTTASSMVEKMRHSGVERPAVVTPYLEASNRGLIKFLAAKHIHTSSLRSLEFKTVEEYENAHAAQVISIAREAGSDPDADGLFIACTQLPTLGILDSLRQSLGMPVLGAVAATVWNAKRMLDAA